MRILHYIASEGIGGMETHVRTLCAEHSKRETVLVIEDKNIHRWNPFSILSLCRRIKKYNPDIIHAHGSKAAQIIAWPLFRRFRRVATVHGIKKRLNFLSAFDAVIAVSKAVAERVNHPFCSVVYNGVIPPDQISPRPVNHPQIVLAVGRFVPVKGFDILIKAWAKVGNAAQLQIAGDGPERKNLERLIRTNGLENRVRILGFRDDVSNLIDRSDLMVISSRREGFSMVMAEALQRECPIVSSNVGGPASLLPPDVVFGIEDSQALAEKVSWALANPKEVSDLLAPLFGLARSDMTVESMARKTEDVYRKVLNV